MLPIETNDIKEYINKNLYKGNKIGIDLKTISANYFTSLEKILKNFIIESDHKNILDSYNEDCNSNLNQKKIFIHELKYAGKSPTEKFRDVRQTLLEKKVVIGEQKSLAIILNKLDDIACMHR